MNELNVSPTPEQSSDSDREEKAPFNEKIILFLVAVAVIIADQLTKNTVESQLLPGESWAPIIDYAEVLKIIRITNTGAAFGIFPSGSLIFMVVGIVVAIVIILYNQRLPRHHEWYRVALGLQLGGALGNLIDRFRQQGHVTDFIDVGPVPIFNIADASIVVGVAMLLFLMLLDERAERANNSSDENVQEIESSTGDSAEDQSMLWND